MMALNQIVESDITEATVRALVGEVAKERLEQERALVAYTE